MARQELRFVASVVLLICFSLWFALSPSKDRSVQVSVARGIDTTSDSHVSGSGKYAGMLLSNQQDIINILDLEYQAGKQPSVLVAISSAFLKEFGEKGNSKQTMLDEVASAGAPVGVISGNQLGAVMERNDASIAILWSISSQQKTTMTKEQNNGNKRNKLLPPFSSAFISNKQANDAPVGMLTKYVIAKLAVIAKDTPACRKHVHASFEADSFALLAKHKQVANEQREHKARANDDINNHRVLRSQTIFQEGRNKTTIPTSIESSLSHRQASAVVAAAAVVKDSGPLLKIERKSGLTAREFVDNYFSWGIPVILTDAMQDWPAFQKDLFSLDKLQSQFPEFRRSGSEKSAAFGLRLQNLTTTSYVRMQYSWPRVLDEFKWKVRNTEFFFFDERTSLKSNDGIPAGTYEHLDKTCGNTMAAHFEGTKRWLLRPISHEFYSKSDKGPQMFLPDNLKQLPRYWADVTKGEILFFPMGYWHSTQVIEVPMLTMSLYWDKAIGKHWVKGLWPLLDSTPKYESCPAEWASLLCQDVN